jgi:energy-coupling factor transporter ATP-binding protein EcfA2
MRGIRADEHVLIVGQNGRGKSVLATYLVEQLQPVRTIVFDPKAEHQLGVTPCRTPSELAQHMHEPLVHFIPSGFDRDSLEHACRIVWSTPGPYRWWIDEAAAVSAPTWIPQGLMLAATQGRQPRKALLVLTQRVHAIHPVLRSEAKHIYMFVPPPIELDLKALAGHVRREAPELDVQLRHAHTTHGDFSHLWYVQDTDELRVCAPVPTGIAPRAPRGQPGQAGDDRGQPATALDDGAAASSACDPSVSASERS